jgi:hypothetical protein
MNNIELQRQHDGSLNLFVAGNYAVGSRVSGIQETADGMAAIVVIPLKHATVSERNNVVPFVPRVVAGDPIAPLQAR